MTAFSSWLAIAPPRSTSQLAGRTEPEACSSTCRGLWCTSHDLTGMCCDGLDGPGSQTRPVVPRTVAGPASPRSPGSPPPRSLPTRLHHVRLVRVLAPALLLLLLSSSSAPGIRIILPTLGSLRSGGVRIKLQITKPSALASSIGPKNDGVTG